MESINNITIEKENKNNKDMSKLYKEYFTKYHFSNEIAKKLKTDLKNIEQKYDKIEKNEIELKNINVKLNDNINKLIDEKKVWTDKDNYMTEFLNKNGFEKPDDLLDFISKNIKHKCICSCPPIEENEKYKELIMNVDILKLNEKERVRVEKENDDLRYNIDIGLNDHLNINNSTYVEKDIIIDGNIKKENILKTTDINESTSSIPINNNEIIELTNKNIELENIIKKYESQTKNNKDNNIKTKYNKKEDSKPYLNKGNNFKCTIKRFEDLTKKSHIKAAKETSTRIKYYHSLYLKTIDDGKSIDDIVLYILKNQKLKIDSPTNNTTCKNRIERCYYIYDLYGEKLDDLFFSITYMAKIYNDDNWKEWLNYLDNFINRQEYKNESYDENSDINNNDIINFKDIQKKINKNNNINDNILKCVNDICDNYFEGYNKYCNTCNENTKECDNCGDEFITDKKYITECGDC